MRSRLGSLSLPLALLACSGACSVPGRLDSAEITDAGPPELGRVDWERDLEAALARAGETERDVLLLFQEVPG